MKIFGILLNRLNNVLAFRACLILVCFFSATSVIYAKSTLVNDSITGLATVNYTSIDKDVFQSSSQFIENIGQYGDGSFYSPQMGNVEYGFEGFDMPVLFTKKGIVFLQRKIVGPSEEEREEAERAAKRSGKKVSIEDELEQSKSIDKTIVMQWMGANEQVQIQAKELEQGYHTYGFLANKANGYKAIRYINLYDGIDVEVRINKTQVNGFEYNVFAKPGADLSLIRMNYSGDLTKIKINLAGQLIVASQIDKIRASAPLAYYSSNFNDSNSIHKKVEIAYVIQNNTVSFKFPKGYDSTQPIVIDPFITSTANLTGANTGKAKDIDFDYAGNAYVTGGGDGTVYKLAKFDVSGTLQWTFNGSMTLPTWSFGTYYGGWVVDKTSGNIYLGQGFAPSGGFRIIRISTTGLYDNYITTANPSFLENWKMYWNCNLGSAQLLIAGGGTNSNINMGICSPPSTVISSNNVTGIPYSGGTGWAQDMVDIIIDPLTNDMYTIYGSLIGTTSLTNKIYKNTAPYSGASVAWSTPSGYSTVQEIANRPYLAGPQIDNSGNLLAVNSSYFYYWDGKNLKAFDKASGATVGTPLTLAANTALMSGGIIADECNNVFIGSINGQIKVYKFNGVLFDDAAAPDITIPGYATASVYDLAFYESQKLLFASGNGFVASIDVSSYACNNVTYSIIATPSCATLSVSATVNPAPPAGATVTYTLFNGTTQLGSNTTGTFSSLTPAVTYTLKAFINLVCSGVVTVTNFVLPGPTISISSTNPTCGNSNGSITAVGGAGTAPFTFSKDGITFQASGLFTGLTSGVYTITVKDANGCTNTALVTLLNSNGPTATISKTDAICGTSNGSVTVNLTGGIAPMTYSVNGVTFQSSNFFTGLVAGNYSVTLKDANGCKNVYSFSILNLPGPQVTAIPSATFCNSNNGSINAYGTGGVAPLQYSINGNIYQSSGLFTALAPGSYTVTVKDANGCINTVSVTVANSPAPTVSAIATAATCNNANGTITATGVGGTAPLMYSIDGISFQSSPYFYGLTAGVYTITVKDFYNCINTVNVTVTNTSAPQITVTTTPSACSTNTGTITATGSLGIAPLQYSINGINFQASTLFSGLNTGNYLVQVKDANGCMSAAFAVILNTAAPTLNLVVTPTSCSASDGVITANGIGGTAPLQYSIDGVNYQASSVFSSLATGNYTISVKDANGCISTASATVNNIAGLSVTATNVSSVCTTNNGFITASGSGGVAPLQYSINGVTFQASPLFTNLGGGIYTITVKDANGCKATTIVNLAVAAQPQLSATVVNTNCASSNGSISIVGSSGTPPYQYSINGITYQSNSTFLNIAAGTYTVYIKDAANCIQTTSVTLTNSGVGPGISTFTVSVDDAYICNGSLGKIKNPKVNGATCATCTYSLNNGAFVPNATNLFLNVSPGTYTVTAMDANGCTKTISVTIAIAVNSTATAVVTPANCGSSNGSITITGIGPNTPYHSSITGIGGPWASWDPTYTYSGLAPGTYIITLADDESFDSGPPIDPGGCIETITVIVPAIGGASLSLSKTDGTCNLSNGSITALGSGGIAPYDYSIDGITYQSSGLFTNLAAGTYTVTVMDGTGCETSGTITVGNSGGPTVTATVTPATCGASNGTILATGVGAAPLQYSINTTLFQAASTFSGLAAGTYTVYVKDVANCYSTTTVVISNAPKPKVTAFAVAATCNSNNGALVAVGSLGASPYQFSIDGVTFQSNTLFLNLSAGNYTITIKDANGCISTTVATVTNLLAPTLTLLASPASCFNANGTITATVVGGVTPYQYSLNGGLFQASNVFSSVISGSQTVTIKDANGCVATKNIVVTNTLGPQNLTATFVNPSCGNSNGSITATASGGVAPLQYSINGITFQASTSFTNVGPGLYTLTVKDANGCTKNISVSLINLAPPSLSVSSTASSCFANDGTITVVATGGTGALTYSINGINFQVSNVFTGLASGNYTVTVKDAKNCTATIAVSVGSLTGVSVTAIPTAAGCMAATGSITATGLGGTTPYQYSLDGITYQVSNVFSALAAGAYTVTIKDASNCINTTAVVNVVNTSGATVTAISSNATCGASNGSIAATGLGGTTPYQFSLDGITYQASNIFTGLAAGAYTVTIKDASNCINTTAVVNVVNTSGATVTAISSNTTCGASNGSITATGLGGTTPYQYSLDGITYQASNIFTGLAAGAYTVTIKDASNCINTTAVVNVVNTSGATVTAISSNATCGASNGSITATGLGGTTPYQYSLDGITYQASNVFTGLAAGAYTVTIKDASNCINTTAVVNVVNTSGATVTAISSNATCGASNGSITSTGLGGTTPYQYSLDGITYQASNIFTGLAAGAYTVTIKDGNNCINTSAVVNVVNTSGATVTAISSNATCGSSNGSITATGLGGITPYQYSLDGITYQASNIFTGLAAGAYTVTIKDASNCINTTAVVNVVNTSGATVTAINSNATCGASNGSITATGLGGTTPYQYSLDGITYQASNVFSALAAGAYTVTIKDANNCINTSAVVNIVNTSGATVTAISSNTTCGASNGSITATGLGGTTPYQYSLDGITYQVSNVFSALAAGAYTVTIKDASNCINTTAVVNIVNTSGATVTAISSNATCGASNGSITATGLGGTTPYQYSLDGITYQASNIFTGLAAGAYAVTIKDASNCINTSAIVNILNTSGATVTAISSNATCGASNGSITATGLGGTTPYQYSLDGITYQASNIFTGLAAGAYTVTIKDANNCINTSAVVNIVNTSGATVTAISSNTTCGASNGSITATGLGGTTPYQYSLDGITYQVSNVFTGLTAGAYTVTIKDASNCINTTAVVNVVNTSGATVTAINSNATCGTSNGSITATGLGGTTPYQYSLDGITYQVSNIFTGLAAGAYTVTIKDASNCINTTAVVNIVNTSGATVTAISSNATCGSSNGSITATGLGGTTPYQFSLDGITYQASNIFTGLAAGAYTVTIKDASNCINTTAVVNVVNTSGATVTAISSNATCGASNGSITATGLGGTTPYQFSLDGITYQASNIFTGLAAGAYTVTIKDASNCINTTAVVNIVNTSGATVTAISSNTTCGASNGSITATGLGGATPYQYSLDGITYQVSNIFTGLAAGAYTVTIKDANNCINTSSILNVNSNSGATVTAISNNTTCGANNGSITSTGLGGTTPYQYSLDGITYQVSNIFTGLAAGAYTVTIKDASNCINNSAVVNVVNTSGATVTAISSNTTCGASNGSITATGLGGTTPYQYSLDGITYQASNIFTGLAAGAYTITIKDANNCINTSAVVNVVNTSGATVTAISSNTTCGASNGSITATGFGGTTPYQYSLDGITYQVSNIFTALAAGAYTVTIKDASNCINTTAVVNIVNTSGATVTAISSNTTCGSSNGSITATGLGGTTPYQYSLDGITYQASNIYTGLAAGVYTVTIKDGNNCINTSSIINVNSNSGATVTAISSNATCGASNGSITATGLGGTTPYQYSLDGITYQASNIFTGLAAGAYTVTIKDANNCINTSSIINVNSNSGATVTAISSYTTCGASNGSITATGLGGTTPYQYSLDGITYQASNIFTGLAAGAYTVTIKDANNCINTSSIINVNSNSGATVTAISSNTTCGASNGSITATGLGGTTPYQYSLDGITYQVSNIFTGLAAGAYTVTIKDASNCNNTSSIINVNSNSGATVTAISSNTTCGASNGSITATGLGGTTPYQYSLDGITYQASNVFTGLAAGAYTVTIKDANNCINTSSIINVNSNSGATVTAISSNTTCGASNGSITATGLGGTTPYQYSLDGITYQASNIFTGLAAGAYTVTIKDGNNCINTSSIINVNSNSGATVTAISSNATCGASNGSITATGLGGTTPYQYSLDGITYQVSNIFTGLAAGAYTVTIKDANNCINTSSIINVNSNSGATVTTISSNTTCGASNGSITATGLGGTTPYQYSLDGITYQASNIYTGLAAGAYTVTIKDASNCINTSSIINVNSNSGATVTAISSNATCGASNGSITATGLGGTTPYQYSLDGITYQASNVFTALVAGAYTVTIKDANNCINTSSIINVNSNSGATVTALSSNTTCGASNGSITATGLGGTTPYQFSLDGITYQVSNIFTGLAAGAYTVTIKDANNCINTSSIINVNSNSGATVTAISSNTTCGASNGSITSTGFGGTTPYQYSLDGITYQASNIFTGLAAGAYTITIKDASNCINTSAVVNILNTSGATVTAISSNTTCGASNGSITATGLGGTTPYQYSLDGITYQASNVFSGLAAGAFTVTIKDANNCINTSSIINVNSNSGATVTAISSNTTCGASNGSITATGLGGTTPYQYSLDGITYQVSNVFSALAAGAYTVTIKDANNCINNSSIINVNSNSGATVTAISSNATCGASNGSITATGLGGTTPYQYSLDGITYQASNIFTGLAAGAYTVTIKDANNCINTSSIINVNSNSGSTVTAISSNTTCGANNGSITATGLGGTTPYQYSLDGITYQASNVFTGLAAGAFTVTIKDANNCINTSSIINLNSNSGATVTAISSNATCGASNGSITATGLGGTTPFQYSLDGITYQASNIFTGLAAGAYTVTIKDANNCINTSSIINVNSNSGATVSAISSNATCGASNGSITATGLGGTTPYQYSLDGITYQVSNIFTGLAAGAYTVTIKDASNCINNSAVVNVVNTSGATVTAISSNASCGASNGSITATGLGGTTPYQYSLDGITYQTSNAFTALAAGAYTVTIKDANNCINTSSIINVNSNSGATVTAISSNTTCGASNGSITATGLGGTTPYQYSLDGITYQASNIFTGLAAGVYTVTIKDANNCINTSSIINVNSNSGATVTAISSNTTCGASNGSITATGLGGTTPYQYSLDGITYQVSNVFTGLAAGAYTVTIKDASNCINTTAVVNIVNTSGATVTAISSNATCGASNGSITATGLGGTTPYQYSLDGITYQASSVFTGLAAGAYTVTIKDANNCINTTAVVNVVNTSGATVTAISSNATCGASNGSITATGLGGTTPYQYSLDGITYQVSNVFSALAAGVYTVTIKDGNNCINTSSIINVNSNSGATVTAISSNTTCGASNGSINATGLGGTTPYQYSLDGITYQASNIFTGLAAGAYTVTIKDASNCINTTAIVNVVNTSGATVTAISSNTTCGASNGSIAATGLGGTTPYQYSLDGITYQASNVFTGLAAGAYTVTIKDASNCINTTAVVNIVNTSGATVTAISSNATCGASNGSITATGLGGTTPYQYSLDGITYQTSNAFTALAAGTYTVTIKDANNCTSSSVLLTISQTPMLQLMASGASTICIGQSTMISAVASGGIAPYTYSWSNGTLAANVLVNPSTTTNYSVLVRDSSNCFSTIQTLTVTVRAPLSIIVSPDDTICEGSTALLNAIVSGGTGGSYHYHWLNLADTTAAIAVAPLVSTTYQVTASDGCTIPDVNATIFVKVNPKPQVDFTISPDEGCEPLTVTMQNLINAGPGSNYLWNFGDTTFGQGSQSIHQYVHQGIYTVSLTVNSAEGCTNTLIKNNSIQVYPKPHAEFIANPWESTLVNSTIKFNDISNGASHWQWEFGDAFGISYDQNVVYQYNDTGHYQVKLSIENNYGCSDTAYGEVVILGEFTYYVPNSFSPNNDGVNDFFGGDGIGIVSEELSIYDRWGILVYFEKGNKPNWDGKNQSDKMEVQEDVYIYEIVVKDIFNKSHNYSGQLTLFR